MITYIRLLRPQQWTKNAFIFLPIFFDRHILDLEYIMPSIYSFFAFSFAASGIYCFNDIFDVEADRKHPVKCMRPIASGKISKLHGYITMFLCFCVAYILLYIGNFSLVSDKYTLYGIITFYVVMNIAYCTYLKNKAIIDVFIIALGFVLRVYVGGAATGIMLSNWIVLMTFLLALFLAFAKRRDDVVMHKDTGCMTRKSIDRYNVEFLNQTIGLIASITMVCYIMYTVSPEVIERSGRSNLYITSVFVLAGIIRYLQVAIVDIKSGSPTKVLIKDRFIQACILGWIITFIIILYL